jgi:hypothetical protein
MAEKIFIRKPLVYIKNFKMKQKGEIQFDFLKYY